MYLYIIFILLTISSVLEIFNIRIKQLPNLNSKLYWTFVLIFFILSTFRWENGTDWDTYLQYYHWLTQVTCIGYMEPGFTLLTSINSVFFNYTTQLGCVAFLSIVPIAWKYHKISPYPLFTLLIWYSTTFANIFPVRQSIAIALFVTSWKFIEEKRLKSFIGVIILAATFHITVLITIPIYFLWHKKFATSTLIFSIIIISAFSIVGDKIISNMLLILGGDLVKQKLEFYLENSSENFGSAYSPIQVLIRGILNRSFIFFPLLFLLKDIRYTNEKLNSYINIYFFSFVLFLLVSPLSIALGRLCMYSDIIQAILIPFIFTGNTTRENKCILFILIIGYFLIRFRGIIFNYQDLYIPYNFVSIDKL